MQQAQGFSAFVSTVYKMWKKKFQGKTLRNGNLIELEQSYLHK